MARVYYRNDAPCGALSEELQALRPRFEELLSTLAPKMNHPVSVDLSATESAYAIAHVWEGGFTYDGLFLPKAIIFGDDFSIPYPEHYAFIALVAGGIEACVVSGGVGVGYQEAPERQRPAVGDELDAVLRSFGALARTALSDAPLPVAAPTPRRRFALPADRLQAYARLLAVSGWSGERLEEAVTMLGELEVEDLKFGPRNALLDHAREQQPLWVYLDHKDQPRDIAWSLERILNQNFGVKYALADPGPGSIYDEVITEHFGGLLGSLGFEMLLIETGGDDYMAAIVPTSARDEAMALYGRVGFQARPTSRP